MMGSRRFDVTEHLSEEELDRTINEAQKADEAQLVRRLCFVKFDSVPLVCQHLLHEIAGRTSVPQTK